MSYSAVSSEVDRSSTKGTVERIKQEYAGLWEEIAAITALVEEVGVKSYKLSASLQDPVIVTYSFT